MSWHLNDPISGEMPNVNCNADYEFVASRDIESGEELTVDSHTYSDHRKLELRVEAATQEIPF
jgi:hypothetical protein